MAISTKGLLEEGGEGRNRSSRETNFNIPENILGA